MAAHGRMNHFIINPKPPVHLWDVTDAAFTDLVACQAQIWVIDANPRGGSYKIRLRCTWHVRLVNLGEATEPRVRVPGIRMPEQSVVVEESRLWRSMSEDTQNTLSWRGVSVFELEGHKHFEVREFPFDRQVLDLGLLHFVWRRDKDSDGFEESMKVVDLSVLCTSVIPEYIAHGVFVQPTAIASPEHGPCHSSSMNMQVRLEREHRFAVRQMFVVSCIVTVVCCLTMAMKPEQAEIGNKLGLVLAGLLSLTSFKYSISDSLPHVPYATFVDQFLLGQLFTLVSVAAESVLAYKLVDRHRLPLKTVDIIEDVVLTLLILGWALALLNVAFRHRYRVPWERLQSFRRPSLADQVEEEEIREEDQAEIQLSSADDTPSPNASARW